MKIKPCPFCGSKAELIRSAMPWVHCTNNMCPKKEIDRWPNPYENLEQRAIKLWNRRDK